jgi:hypothetical protein
MQKGMEQQQGADGGCWTSIWTGERAEKYVRRGRRGVTCAEAQRKRWKGSAARTTARTRTRRRTKRNRWVKRQIGRRGSGCWSSKNKSDEARGRR